jgi:hypothetical protein
LGALLLAVFVSAMLDPRPSRSGAALRLFSALEIIFGIRTPD